jgi:hypothetical protein
MTKSRLACVFVILPALLTTIDSQAQRSVTLTVEIGAGQVGNLTASYPYYAIITGPLENFLMQEVVGTKRTPVVYQRFGNFIYWTFKADGKQTQRTFELVKGKPREGPASMTAKDSDGGIVLQSGSTNLLKYQVTMVYPPAGIDSAYRRNGFIHPLWAPNGQELTRIQPKDHYHHYGIWNPWTHVLYKGDTVDFWNIGGKKGTVRIGEVISKSSGPLLAGFEARHEHIVTKKGTQPETAIIEMFSAKAWPLDDDTYVVDIESHLTPATQSPVVLLTYRYGGLGWRTTEVWDNQNSEVITSEGKGRKEADGSKARWCIVQGALGSDYGGAVMMSHPDNYNYPEPLRVWPENQYKRGDMFANFSPTKDKDWSLVPGRHYYLKYRFLVFNGKMTKEKAEAAWLKFANPPMVTIN